MLQKPVNQLLSRTERPLLPWDQVKCMSLERGGVQKPDDFRMTNGHFASFQKRSVSNQYNFDHSLMIALSFISIYIH